MDVNDIEFDKRSKYFIRSLLINSISENDVSLDRIKLVFDILYKNADFETIFHNIVLFKYIFIDREYVNKLVYTFSYVFNQINDNYYSMLDRYWRLFNDIILANKYLFSMPIIIRIAQQMNSKHFATSIGRSIFNIYIDDDNDEANQFICNYLSFELVDYIDYLSKDFTKTHLQKINLLNVLNDFIC